MLTTYYDDHDCSYRETEQFIRIYGVGTCPPDPPVPTPPPPPDPQPMWPNPWDYIGGCNDSIRYYFCSLFYGEAAFFHEKFNSNISDMWYFTSTGSDGNEYKCMASYINSNGDKVDNIKADYHTINPVGNKECLSSTAFEILLNTSLIIDLNYSSCAGVIHAFDTGIYTTYEDPDSTYNCAETNPEECSVIPSVIPEGELGDDDPDSEDPCGSPVWKVNMANMNLFITDTPLWYNPTVGPSVNITLSHNSRSSAVIGSPFGSKWNFNYSSYLVEDASSNVTVIMPDGREDVFTSDGAGGYTNEKGVLNTLAKYTGNFEVEFPDGTVYVYDMPFGTDTFFPGKIRDAYSNELTVTYDVNNRIAKITDATLKEFIFNYTVGNDDLLDSISDPFGRSAQFTYYANGDLKKTTDMEGYWAEFDYDANGYVKSITKGKDTAVNGTWGFITELPDGTINWMTPYPSPQGSMGKGYRITMTNPQGSKDEYYSLGTYSWHVSPNDYVTYRSDEINNYKSAKKTLYFLTDTKTTGKISKIVSPEGGYKKFMNHDPVSGEPGVIEHSHEGGVTHTETYTYTANGLIDTLTDSKGNKTRYIYYPNNIDVQEIRYDLSSTPGDDNILIRSLTYNGNTHDIAAITDRAGTLTEISYYPNGQIEKMIGGKGTAVEMTTEMVYDAGTHELLEIKKGGSVIESFTYDNKGRVWTHTDDKGIMLTYEYNNLDKVTKITWPDNKFETITYSTCCPNLLDTVTDRAGLTTTYVYDKVKRLKEIQGPKGVIKYEYDKNGNRTKLTDADGKVTLFEYDKDNRLTKKTYADNNSVSFGYDPSGLLKEFTNARGITKRYYYDGNHNITNVDYFDNTPDVTFIYDDYNNLKERQDGSGAYIYGYDLLNRLTSIDGPWADDNVEYQYNELGHVKKLRSQTGVDTYRETDYFYDYDTGYADADIGRLKDIQTGTNTYTYDYTGVNPLIQKLTRPNGSYTEYVYNDPLKRLTEIANKDFVQAVIDKHAFTYNNLDVIGTETVTTGTLIDNFTVGQTTYTYNNVNQLSSSTNPAQSFTYDNDGNMTKGYTPGGYQFSATYDAENRLKTVTYTVGSINYKTEYSYSGDNFLAEIMKYENTALVKTIRIVRAGFMPVQERDETNTIKREYTWGLDKGGGIGGLLNLKEGVNDSSYLYDGKGNVMAVLDSNQAVVASYRYDEFGNLMKKTGTFNQPFMFSTKRYDEQTGLSYYGYRFYNPAIGRWMTRDPLGEAGGINLYGFVGNSPINWRDPYGLLNPATGAGAAVGSVIMPGPGTVVGAIIGTAIGIVGGELVWDNIIKPWFFTKPTLPKDPAESPGEGWEWRGKDPPGGKRGGWHNPETGESLHPDLDHPAPVGPHWDYVDPKGNKHRLPCNK